MGVLSKILFGTTSTSAVAAMEHMRDDEEEAMREQQAGSSKHDAACYSLEKAGRKFWDENGDAMMGALKRLKAPRAEGTKA